MTNVAKPTEPTTKTWTIESVKNALPALLAAGADVMPADQRSQLLMSAAAALLVGATKAGEGGVSPEIMSDVELAGKACTAILATRTAAAPAADAAAAPPPAEAVAAGKAEGPSDSEVREALEGALKDKFPRQETDDGWINRIWVADVFPGESLVVYDHDHACFQIGYAYDAATGVATLTGEPVEVRRVYQPMGEPPAPPPEGAAETPPAGGTETQQSTDGAAEKTAKGTAPPAVVPWDLGAAFRKTLDEAAVGQ